MYFLGFSTWGLLFYVTAFGLKGSGFGSDVFFSFFDLRLLFLSYCAWFKGVGFRFWCILLVFELRLLFLCYCGSFKGVGFRLWCIFWVFWPEASFCYVTAVRLRVSGLGSDVFFGFFDLRLAFLWYFAWFKGVGFRFRCRFLVFRLEASLFMLLRLV